MSALGLGLGISNIIAIFLISTILIFEIVPMSTPYSILAVKINRMQRHNDKILLSNQRPEEDHIIATNLVSFSSDPATYIGNKKRNKLTHSTFRVREDVIEALYKQAQRKGVSLSSLVNKTLENYVTSEMYFEELGFILVSKDFLRKTFYELKENNLEKLGRDLGMTVAQEYVSYFFPEVNSDTLVNFLDLWFKRFQSYQHRFDSNKKHHYFVVNHDINLNFSIALKAMLEGLMEPILKRTLNFRDLTPCSITFSFEDNIS
ncbi:MAG TPA: hypothetical protein VJ729_12700 [Nitrososphaeraceae archaeon]|nr:hypothetical protein [Nitrososphaeraceae archaeon]